MTTHSQIVFEDDTKRLDDSHMKGKYRRKALYFCILSCVLMVSLSFYAVPNIRQQRTSNALKTALLKFPQHINTSFNVYQLNVAVSDVTPLNRHIPDTRPKECSTIKYDVTELPTASIIIPFHNEAWSMMLRAITSILNRTPEELLKEIILVDDASTRPFLKEPLEQFLWHFGGGKVRVIRNGDRLGLMQARIRGAMLATGDVLVFLDAHVECNVRWLEPLLLAIKQNATTVAIPTIDLIDVNTIEYVAWGRNLHGGLKWTLDYEWKPTPYDKVMRSPIEPIKTPTTIGCAIAINRKYFFKIGMFDEGMRIWGGENLELSIRTWLCGGALYIYPCARVGHVFRSYLPYQFPPIYGGVSVIYKNLQRVAEVWMDEYKQFYYASVKHRYKMTMEEAASLHQRRLLRKRLKCAGFSWYLNHVIPEMSVPSQDSVFFGQINHVSSQQCIYTSAALNIHVGVCQDDKSSTFDLKRNQQLVNYKYSLCFGMSHRRGAELVNCSSSSIRAPKWVFVLTSSAAILKQLGFRDKQKPTGQLVYRDPRGPSNHELCLSLDDQSGRLVFVKCEADDVSQFWVFTYMFDYTSVLKTKDE